MKRKYVYAIAAAICAVGIMGTGAIVSNAAKPDVPETRTYTDVHGNKVIEILNPVDPGNEPAAAPEDHPSDLGEVQGDIMTAEIPVVEDESVPQTVENTESTPVTLEEPQVDGSEGMSVQVQRPSATTESVQQTSEVITYTDACGNRVTEYLNPVDPGNEPATIPDYVPSTEGNIQGGIMTLQEPIIMH